MTDTPRYPNPDGDDDTGARGDREPATSTPWGTYAFVIITIVLVLGLALLHLTGTVGPGAP